jgi:cytochrome c oxidase accessory protein FixG
MAKHVQDKDYRDHLSTVDREGKRIWVYPKKPKGKFTNYRTWVAFVFLAFLFAGPHIRISGQPLLQLDFLGRKFIIFGKMFFPADAYIFVIITITAVVSIILFTVAFGRLFCGWMCPQTVFMEMVFRKVEYWIEGDFKQQMKLNKEGWNSVKIRKKLIKHVIFFGISFLIANTFLAYIIGSEALWQIQIDDPLNHIGGLAAITIFTFVFYFVFSQLREQVCTTICPYGRLQGVLLDKDSIVVAYDYKRGEGRAKFRKGEDRKEAGKGDCIDCFQCVDVCPTGIDIRNGTQLECVNCTVCMDACDDIMESVGLEKGLIRYASENEISEGKGFTWTTRMIAYASVLTILTVAMVTMLFIRNDVQAIVLRSAGTLYTQTENGDYQNIYTVKLLNKTNEQLEIQIKDMENIGVLVVASSTILLEPQKEFNTAMILTRSKEEISKFQTDVEFGIYANGELVEEVSSTFVGPIKK